MAKATVAELVTTMITGETIRKNVVEVLDFTIDDERRMRLDVILEGGRRMSDVDALDVFSAWWHLSPSQPEPGST